MENIDDSPQVPLPAEEPPAVLNPLQLAARRANARKSTGPRTAPGKAVARLNALKHGFFAGDVVNAELDGRPRARDFNSILAALLKEYKPKTATARILVEEVATSCWRTRRLLRYECRETWVDEDDYRRDAVSETRSDAIFASMGCDTLSIRVRREDRLERSGLDAFLLPSEGDVDKIVRYERTVKRNLYRALEALERMRPAPKIKLRNEPKKSPEIAPISGKRPAKNGSFSASRTP